ncbi:MAG: RsbRD N-terminal domain-containing protein [Desulfohalobiaceae bacterium]|nr:RsbRD N-terminal domain-containing protein [Desulfohalobiaceae bacterium]
MNAPQDQFREYLRRHRDKIVHNWLDAAMASYPEDTVSFLKRQKDRFANPVGATLSRELDNIFEELLSESSTQQLPQSVDAVVRVRAVQDFSPSQALQVFTVLKDVLRRQLDRPVRENGWQAQYREFEDKVDQLCMLAFDIYVKCKEQLWELKARQAQDRVSYLLRKYVGTDGSNNPAGSGSGAGGDISGE